MVASRNARNLERNALRSFTLLTAKKAGGTESPPVRERTDELTLPNRPSFSLQAFVNADLLRWVVAQRPHDVRDFGDRNHAGR